MCTQSNYLLLESCCTISQDMEAMVFVSLYFFFRFCIFIYLLIRLFILYFTWHFIYYLSHLGTPLNDCILYSLIK